MSPSIVTTPGPENLTHNRIGSGLKKEHHKQASGTCCSTDSGGTNRKDNSSRAINPQNKWSFDIFKDWHRYESTSHLERHLT